MPKSPRAPRRIKKPSKRKMQIIGAKLLAVFQSERLQRVLKRRPSR